MRAIADIHRGAEQLTPCTPDINAVRRFCGTPRHRVAAALALAAVACAVDAGRAFAAGPGDVEIPIGNTMRVKVNHPFEPDLSLIRNAITFSGTPVKEYRAPPLLGANTNEVLTSIGYDEAKVRGLRERKVI